MPLLAICLVLLASCCQAYTGTPERPNNPYGMMLMCGGDDATDGMLLHFRLAHDFCGEWGYVRTGSVITTDPGAIDNYARTYAGLRAIHLIPVLTAMRPPRGYFEDNNADSPKRDPDGSLTTFGKAIEDWARALYAKGVTIPYFEFGNEVNGGFYGDHPEVYADMCIAASKALKRVDPTISFGTAGMAGCGDDFYDKMLTVRPELAKHVDHWGLHPYAANHPPGYAEKIGNYGVESHLWTAKALARHGIKNPVFIMTETGYELGNEKDRNFPKITEENRAEYLVEAYERYWVPDPRVRGVMPFMLQDTKWSGWDGWDFIREDYSRTPMYDAIAALPKPKGSDFMPAGPCALKGQMVDEDLGRPIDGMIIWLWRPNKGGYAAVTDSQGRYFIANVPEATYNITAYRDGFQSAPQKQITLKGRKPIEWSQVLKRTGLLVIPDADGGAISPGWLPARECKAYAVDTAVKRSGKSSQRIDADGFENSVWNITNYVSCLPNREYSCEVWVKTKGLEIGGKSGAVLHMEMTDSFAREMATARVALEREGDNDWTPLQIVFKTPPKARRMRVYLVCEAEKGSVWFDDLFLGESTWPLPSVYAFEKRKVAGAKSISGTVHGPKGVGRLQRATVWAIPTGKWTTTDYLGMYEIKGLPEGSYRVVASHPDYSSGSLSNISAGSAKQDIEMLQRPAPSEIQAGDFEDIPTINTWFTGWQRYGSCEGIVANGWHKGIAKEAFPDGFQAHSGSGFYGAVAGSNIKDGMIYQTIAVEPDALYEVSVWSMTYQTDDGSRGDVANRLGADPMGGRDPKSPYVIWTPLRASHGKWTQIKLRVRPTGNRLTVYLHHLQVQGLVFNCNFFDDCKVEKIGPPEKTMDSGNDE